MIFAAGLGTRLHPLTLHKPKALVEVDGVPLLGILLEKMRREGADEVVVNVYHMADQILDYLERNVPAGLRVKVSDERPHLLDTGGGLVCGAAQLGSDRPLLVHNVDILSNAPLHDVYEQMDEQTTDVLVLVSNRTSGRHLLFDEEMRMVGWENVATGEVRSPWGTSLQPTWRGLAFSGIHVVTPKALEVMKGWGAAFSIMDFYVSQCANLRIRGVELPDLRLLDVGKPASLLQASEFLSSL